MKLLDGTRRLRSRLPPLAPTSASAACVAAFVLSACGQPQAMGQPSSLIVVAPDSLWAEVEDSTYAVLEPTIFTVRDENRFNVTQVDPTSGEFQDLRNFRQLLVFGTADDPLIRQVAAAADRFGTLEVPSVFRAGEVWAHGQVVTAILLEEGREVESWLSQLPAVLGMVDSDYRSFVRAKMFVTPPDSALTAQLSERFGFAIVVPEVYDHVVREGPLETVVILRNDNPDPSQLIRSILVTWRDGVDSLTDETALAWRADVDGIHYNVPQRINADRSTVAEFEHRGEPALEVTGVWEDEEGNYPAAGPFIVWLVRCGERTFMLDAWLYAPGRDKYEYVLQLREILGSFACAITG